SPDWSLLPVGTPPPVRRLLERCLEKDPKQRLRDIGDARVELEQLVRGSTGDAAATRQTDRPEKQPTWFLVAAAVVVALVSTVLLLLARQSDTTATAGDARVSRFEVNLPNGQVIGPSFN